jgi:hypothetical protein
MQRKQTFPKSRDKKCGRKVFPTSKDVELVVVTVFE